MVNGPNVSSDFWIGIEKSNVFENIEQGTTAGVCYDLDQGNYAAFESMTPICTAFAPNQGNNNGNICLDVICVAGYMPTFSKDCRGQINMNPGTDLECTVTNTYLGNRTTTFITVYKDVVNDDGGTLQPSDFWIHVQQPPCVASNHTGTSAGEIVNLWPGLPYVVTETLVTGYTASYSAGCSGTLSEGQTAICRITNNDNDVQVGTE